MKNDLISKLFDIDLNIIILMKELITYIYVRKYIMESSSFIIRSLFIYYFFFLFFSLRDSFLNLKFPVLRFEDLSPVNKCRFYIQGCYCFRERFKCFDGFELNFVFYFFFIFCYWFERWNPFFLGVCGNWLFLFVFFLGHHSLFKNKVFVCFLFFFFFFR